MAPDFFTNSISTSGTIITDVRTWDEASSVFVQDNGRIVVVGSACAVESGDGDFVVVRYKSNGTLDTAFDGDGVVTTGFGTFDAAYDALVQPDGKILAVGFTAEGSGGADLALARYNIDGSLDSGFGSGGKVVSHIDGIMFEHPVHVAVQSDGKILVTSDSSGSGDFLLVRYDEYGALDSGFGSGGVLQTDIGGEDESDAVVIQSDGKIVVAGISYPSGYSGSTDFVIARYNSNGSLDTAFDGDGKVLTNFGGEESFGALTLHDGKIIVVGSSDAGGGSMNIAIARYNSNGSLDTSFDGDGRLITVLSGESDATSVRVQNDGKIIVAGVVQGSEGSSGSGDFVVLRYNSNGSLDTGFGDGGKVVADFGGDDTAKSVALQADGKIVVTGTTDKGSGVGDIVVMRLNSDGSLDESFGGGSAESHPEWDFYQTPTGLTLFPGQYAVLYVEAYAADADGDPVSYYGVPGYMDGSVFTPLPGMDTFPLTKQIDGLLSTVVLLPDTTPTGDYLFRIFADDDTGDSVPGVFFDVPVAIIDKSNFHELHFCDYGFPAWVRADWFRFDFFIAYTDFGYTVKTVLTWHDLEDGHERRESGMLSFGEVGNFNQSRFELLGTDTVALMGDADLDGKPDGFHSDDGVAVTFVWQPRNADGVVATFAVNAGSDSGSSGTLFDLDCNNAVDYARITEPDGLTIMQKFSFVDTDGNGQPDTIEIVSASVYLLTFGYDLPFTEYVYFDGHNYIEDGNFVAPLLSIDEESVSIYHYRGQGVIADADATDADGNLLVFTLVGAPDDGSGNPLFSIDAETGQISLTGAGEAWIHSASSTESFDLTIRVTDGAHDETARLSVNLRDTPEFYNGRVNVISCGSGEGVDGVSVTLTEKWATNATPATPATNEGYGQYGFSSLVEGDYALTVNRDVDDRDREAIDLEDVYTALTLVVDDFVDDKEQCHTSPYQYLAADIDRDGTVGFRDALGILKMALHREDAPAPEWAIVPESAGSEPMDHDNVIWPDADITVTMDQDKEIDLVGVLMGDVDGSWGA